MNTLDSVALSYLILGAFLMFSSILLPAKWEGKLVGQNWRMGVFLVGPSVILAAAVITILGDLI